ncbi:hypothetical protein [uncultured Chryseobacterium sp.]|uniref:hypothetical protein n=1 Tax=uncultured Chryseobacterium sp. TaxID=259322 RepID=UPI0025D2F4FA|nr:hypothetical protein [uncultured Chryseobacterium sp.]
MNKKLTPADLFLGILAILSTWPTGEPRERSHRRKESSVDRFKIATVALLLLLIGSYLFYFFCLDGASKISIPCLTD